MMILQRYDQNFANLKSYELMIHGSCFWCAGGAYLNPKDECGHDISDVQCCMTYECVVVVKCRCEGGG